MNKLIIALMALMMLFIAGCASSGGTATGDGGGLPEIAAYDDEAVELLPDTVAAEM